MAKKVKKTATKNPDKFSNLAQNKAVDATVVSLNNPSPNAQNPKNKTVRKKYILILFLGFLNNIKMAMPKFRPATKINPVLIKLI